MKYLSILIAVLILAFPSTNQAQTPEQIEALTKLASDPNTTPEDIERFMADMVNKKKKADGAVEFTKIEDKGVSSDLHKANLNKLVFSNKAIPESATTTALKSSFPSLSGGIYARIFLKESLRNMLADVGMAENAGSTFIVQYFFNGELVNTAHNNRLEESTTNTATSWALAPAPVATDKKDYKNVASGFAEALRKKKAGKYNIKVVILCEHEDPLDVNNDVMMELGTGEFELSYTEAEKTAFIKKHEFKYESSGTKSSGSRSSSKSSTKSSSSSSQSLDIKFVLYNKTGSQIQGKVVGPNRNSSRTFSVNGNSKTTLSGKIGGTIQIGGKTFRTLSAGDNGKTIEIK